MTAFGFKASFTVTSSIESLSTQDLIKLTLKDIF